MRNFFRPTPALYALSAILVEEETGAPAAEQYMPRILRTIQATHHPAVIEIARPFVARFLATPAEELPEKDLWPQVCLALRMRETAHGLGRDPADAVKRWRLMAEAGCAEAMDALGQAYSAGNGVEKQPEQAKIWWEKAASAGSKPSYVMLGQYYLNGRPGPDEIARARDYLNKALPHPMAGTMLAVLDLNTGDAKSRATGRLTLESLAKPEAWEPDALIPFERLPRINTPNVLRFLGLAYLQGQGGKADPAKALEALSGAARSGDGIAMFLLHDLFTKGIDGAPNPEEGLRWLRHAAEFDAEFNGIPACFVYGLKCREVNRDILEWARHVRHAAKQNFVPAMQELGMRLLDPNRSQTRPAQKEGLHWITMAAEAGDPGSMAQLAFLYGTGAGGVVPRNVKTADQWAKQARNALNAALNSSDSGIRQEAEAMKPSINQFLENYGAEHGGRQW